MADFPEQTRDAINQTPVRIEPIGELTRFAVATCHELHSSVGASRMTIRVATMADLRQVVQMNLRLAFESSAEITPPEAEAAGVATRSFFEAHLDSPFSRTWVVEVNHKIVAVGTLVLFVRPPVPEKMAAIEAYFSNMYTLPEFRRRGYATAILAAATSYAQSQGLTTMWLHTTEAARALYESAGFQNPTTCSELKSA